MLISFHPWSSALEQSSRSIRLCHWSKADPGLLILSVEVSVLPLYKYLLKCVGSFHRVVVNLIGVVILHDYESKKLLAFDDLRMLNKRTNWSKSLEEMYEQNLLDFYLFEEKIEKINAGMFRKDKGKVAEIQEVSQSIREFWASSFGLLYRVIWRINLTLFPYTTLFRSRKSVV